MDALSQSYLCLWLNEPRWDGLGLQILKCWGEAGEWAKPWSYKIRISCQPRLCVEDEDGDEGKAVKKPKPKLSWWFGLRFEGVVHTYVYIYVWIGILKVNPIFGPTRTFRRTSFEKVHTNMLCTGYLPILLKKSVTLSCGAWVRLYFHNLWNAFPKTNAFHKKNLFFWKSASKSFLVIQDLKKLCGSFFPQFLNASSTNPPRSKSPGSPDWFVGKWCARK